VYDNLAASTAASGGGGMNAYNPPVSSQNNAYNLPHASNNSNPYGAGSSGAYNGNAVPPSIHIVNQNAYSGARVVQSCSSEFTSRGGIGIVVSAAQLGVTGGGVWRDSVSGQATTMSTTRSAGPQEHVDLTPTHLHLPTEYHPIHFENEISPEMGGGGGGLDRLCPVCNQNFSHISMDEFQTHVFECFDDTEESSGPDTLQPQGNYLFFKIVLSLITLHLVTMCCCSNWLWCQVRDKR
jgi:hypothetical protein